MLFRMTLSDLTKYLMTRSIAQSVSCRYRYSEVIARLSLKSERGRQRGYCPYQSEINWPRSRGEAVRVSDQRYSLTTENLAVIRQGRDWRLLPVCFALYWTMCDCLSRPLLCKCWAQEFTQIQILKHLVIDVFQRLSAQCVARQQQRRRRRRQSYSRSCL